MSQRHCMFSLIIALFVAACGPFHRGSANANSSDYSITFVNESLDQADVFAIPSSGNRVRIGTVQPGRTERLTLPRAAVGGDGTINIFARLLANSRTPSTGRISIIAGQPLEVTLPPSENMLSVLPGSE